MLRLDNFFAEFLLFLCLADLQTVKTSNRPL